MEPQGGLLQVVEMTERIPIMDDPGLPVNIGVVLMKPGVTQDEGLVRGFQDVELDLFKMVARLKLVNQSCLVREGSVNQGPEQEPDTVEEPAQTLTAEPTPC